MKQWILVAAFLASAAHASPGGRVAGSKHDLSVTGPGVYRAASERNPCVFCHISHRSGTGLTNRPDIGGGHRPYDSSTMSTRPGAPTGASRLCLSCHDGTIAVGRTRNGEIAMMGGSSPIAVGRKSNLGTDLRGSHPISFRPAPGRRSALPPSGDAVKLDRSGEVQCTSCHDPHAEWGDPQVGKFLVKPSAGAALCTTCHTSVWGQGLSSHATSSSAWTSPDAPSATTVAQAGCTPCHTSHGGDVRGRLLRQGTTDDDLCLACHAATTTRHDIGRELGKASAHVSRSRGIHDPAEKTDGAGRGRLPEVSAGAPRHVACVDCHNPHASNPAPAIAPATGGALAGVWGVGIDGQRVDPARFEYEVCLKCHGDSANKPQTGATTGFDRVQRAAQDFNLRRVFEPSAASYHPVAAPGKNPLVPSLKAPYSTASMIYCTDCHASDDGAGVGGAGPRGPHGSSYAHLLERQYLTSDRTIEGPSSYALCYKCHERTVLLSNASGFPSHAKHVIGSATPCSACHDAHGVSNVAGNDRENAHLVSFDLSIVKSSGVPPSYSSDGPGHGSCNLTCHGRVHDGVSDRY